MPAKCLLSFLVFLGSSHYRDLPRERRVVDGVYGVSHRLAHFGYLVPKFRGNEREHGTIGASNYAESAFVYFFDSSQH